MNNYLRIEKCTHNIYFLNDNNIFHIDMGDSLYIPINSKTEKKIEKFLRSNGIDCDFFVDKDNQFTKLRRSKESKLMLTVKDIINFLKTQDPDALVLGFEMNSNAYISQFKEPQRYFIPVHKAKEDERKYRRNYYKGMPEEEMEKRISLDIEEIFRYSRNNDIIIEV